MVSGRAELKSAIRAAAPGTQICAGLLHGHHVDADEARRAAFDAGALPAPCQAVPMALPESLAFREWLAALPKRGRRPWTSSPPAGSRCPTTMR